MVKADVRVIKQVVVNGQEEAPHFFYVDCKLPSAPVPQLVLQFGGFLGAVGPFKAVRYNFPEQRYELLLDPIFFIDSNELNFGQYSADLETAGWTGV